MMTIAELLQDLKRAKPDAEVIFDFGRCAPTTVASSRGDYSQPANQLDHFRPLNKRAGGTNTQDNVRPICNSCNHKRDHGWHGEEIAIREAEMLRAIQEMLRDSGTASAGLPGCAANGTTEKDE